MAKKQQKHWTEEFICNSCTRPEDGTCTRSKYKFEGYKIDVFESPENQCIDYVRDKMKPINLRQTKFEKFVAEYGLNDSKHMKDLYIYENNKLVFVGYFHEIKKEKIKGVLFYRFIHVHYAFAFTVAEMRKIKKMEYKYRGGAEQFSIYK